MVVVVVVEVVVVVGRGGAAAAAVAVVSIKQTTKASVQSTMREKRRKNPAGTALANITYPHLERVNDLDFRTANQLDFRRVN